jgi:hypothetical protein
LLRAYAVGFALADWLRVGYGYGFASLRVVVLFLCVAYGFAPILRGFLLDKVFTRLCGEIVLADGLAMLLFLQLDPQILRLT